ncbi:MAG TPA: hypothetical protein VJW73_07165 [Gemmatimonadaceae bacterium]|nr:hypothetical protein [Gemmatimonadaceae bacterium]
MHLDLLQDYWSRCAGFLDLARAAPRPIHASFFTADWVLCPIVATAEANADVRRYATTSDRAALSVAWKDYVRTVKELSRVASADDSALDRALTAFESVRTAAQPGHA